MGLKRVNMNECNVKCRCQKGPNAGKLYNVEEPCPYGYPFNEENCDCPQPCDWCPDPFPQPTDPPLKQEGRCGVIGPNGMRTIGFTWDLVGTADIYWGQGSIATGVNGCGRLGSDSLRKLRWWGKSKGLAMVYGGGCPPREDGSDLCRQLGLYYEPAPYMCGGLADDNPLAFLGLGGGLGGAFPVRARLAEDPYWQPGAWKSVWLVDPTQTPNTEEYWLKRLINTPGNTATGRFANDVSYGIGTFELQVRCLYA